MELGLHREQYLELVEELRRQGHDAALVAPEEERGIPKVDPGEVFDVTLQVFDHMGESAP